MIVEKKSVSESGHWYTADGTPMYQIMGKSGRMRSTTLADARKLNLFPSVTTILRCMAAPGLEQWKRQNLLLAAATLPKIDGESSDDWIKRVENDAEQQAANARQKGEEIHGDIERGYRGLDHGNTKIVDDVMFIVENAFGQQEWKAEKSFADPYYKFAGKIDLWSRDVIIDFKTSGFDDPKAMLGYDEHLLQLCGYRVGTCTTARLANVYISTKVEGMIVLREWTPKDIERGTQMFHHLLAFWKLQKKFA